MVSPLNATFTKKTIRGCFQTILLNQNNPKTPELTNGFFKQLDEEIGSDEFKETVFGTKKATKYTHQPIVRTPVGEGGVPNPDKHPYMKIKL
jgi:hypothetical protein